MCMSASISSSLPLASYHGELIIRIVACRWMSSEAEEGRDIDKPRFATTSMKLVLYDDISDVP